MSGGASVYRFGDWRFDRRSGELCNGRERHRLAPKPGLILALLLDRAGQVVSRYELQTAAWADTVVDYDRNLNYCIREIRSALGESATAPAYVETLARRGYRFALPVRAEIQHADQPASGLPRPMVAALAGVVIVLLAAGMAVTDRPAPGPPPQAVEAAEMGGYLLTQGQGDELARSVGYFRDAIAASPDYARAHSGLGAAYTRLGRIEEGEAALLKSLALDPAQWAPHLTLAMTALYTKYDRESAGYHFDHALRRAPGHVVVRHTYAWFQAVTGNFEPAISHMLAALTIDPVSPRVNGDVGRLYYLAGRYDEAIAHCRKTLQLTGDRLRQGLCVVSSLQELGELERAEEVALDVMTPTNDTARQSSGQARSPEAALLQFWRRAGQALDLESDRGSLSPVYAASAWARAGEPERALERLNRAWARRCPLLPQVRFDPAFDGLGDLPGFVRLMTDTDVVTVVMR